MQFLSIRVSCVYLSFAVAYYTYIKALHLIFVVTWFAGLFYIPRLFIYHIEANAKPRVEREVLVPQLQLMTKRLWFIITWPSAILCTSFAIALLIIRPILLQQPWMQIKLGFVVLLIAYHLKCHQIFGQLQRNQVRYTSRFMRIFNEVTTLVLFAVVFLALTKSTTHWIYGVVGIVLLGVLLMLGIKVYKKIRERNPNA